MGLSSSKSTTTQNAKQQEEAVTMPVLPGWVEPSFNDYSQRIQAFGAMDPNRFVAPASPLQTMAWDNAQALGDWQPQVRLASERALSAGGKPASLTGPAAQMTAAGAQAQGYAAPAIAEAAAPDAAEVRRVTLGPAALVSAQGYAVPDLPLAQGYAAARAGSPIGATSQSYAPAVSQQATIAPTREAIAATAEGASGLTNLQAYQNRYGRELVEAAAQDLDRDAGFVRAREAAAAAKAGAFGGSRLALREAETEGALARAKATTLANLRAQGFDRAVAASGQDADRMQQAGLFNAGRQTDVSLANAGAANARELAQAQLGQQNSQHNAEAQNEASRFGAEAYNQATLFNAGETNRSSLFDAGQENAARQFGASAQNQFDLARAGINAEAGQYGAEAANRAALANAAAQNQFGLGQFGADHEAAAQDAAAQNQVGLAHYQSELQRNLAQAGLQKEAGQFGAAAANQLALAQMAGQNQAEQYNASARDQMAQFNAGQEDAALARQLQSAAMLGGLASDYGAGVRSDLGLMRQMGEDQRAIEQQYALAPLAQLQAMAALYGATPFDVLAGRTTSKTTNSSGSSVTKQSPSLFSQMLTANRAGLF